MIDRPVRTYSSGMAMRLGFAIATFLQADVLLLDEVFAVGDENFQRKCFGVIAAFKTEAGRFCSFPRCAGGRAALRAGDPPLGRRETYDGPTHEAIARYRRLLADDPTRPSAARACASGGAARPRSSGAPARFGRRRAASSSWPASRSASRSTSSRHALSSRRSSTSRCATDGTARGRGPCDRVDRLAGRARGGCRRGSTSTGRRLHSAASGAGRAGRHDGRTLHQFDDAAAFSSIPTARSEG